MFQKYLTGLQHIGIPTRDVNKTVAFYESLGFKLTYRLSNEQYDVAFLNNQGMVIETYGGEVAEVAGAIDHIAINVTDIEAVFQHVKDSGYTLIDQEIVSLPFFDKGCRYFMIEGPNKERVEFSQIS